MRVKEIFHTLQGEGRHTGTTAVFIRFCGCNLRCPFCDTDFEGGSEMNEDEIIAEVRKYQAAHVVITGGEPTLQLTPSLLQKLKSAGYYIQIETNGTNPLDASSLGLIDWITCSPKGAPVRLQRVDELKVVFGGSSAVHPDEFSSLLEATGAYPSLQPCDMGNNEENARILADTIAYILWHPQWHLSLQTHKMLNIP